MDSQVQILGVVVGNTTTGKTYYDVNCSDGVTRRCWNAQLAQKINTFSGSGQVVTLRYDVTQNGQYTNYSVKGVFGPGEPITAAPVAAPMQQGAPMQAVPMGTAPIGGPPMQQAAAKSDKFPPEVTTRIVKMAAYSDAANLVGSLLSGAGPEAFTQALELLDVAAKHIYTQSRSHEAGGPTTVQQGGVVQQIVPVADNAAGVAEFANAQLPGAVQVGTAVAQQQDASAEAPDNIDWN